MRVESGVPTEVRHYWRAASAPFRNLSDLDDAGLDDVVDDLMKERRTGAHHRAFGRRYMELRRLTEARMRELFVASGGRPQRTAPHYFVLGQSSWFKGLADDMQEITLDLSALPTEVTSCTYPDSFTAMEFAPAFGLPYEPRPYHGRVYRLEDLADLVVTYGLPADLTEEYTGYENRPFECYIEVQLWADGPIKEYIEGSGQERHLR